MRTGTGMAGLIISCALATSLHANGITLSTSSLPSTQGWSFVTQGALSESQVFSVSGGLLHQDSLGGGPYAYNYQQPGVVASVPFVLDWDARLVNEENSYYYFFNGNADGFAVEADTGSLAFAIGLGLNGLSLLDQDPQPTPTQMRISAATLAAGGVSLTDFHDYRLVADPTTDTWNFYIDGTFWAAGHALIDGAPNNLYFGDNTGGPNAQGDIAAFSYEPLSDSSVPEPASLLLLASGLAATRRFLRRLRPPQG
jgi:hypothetical protein